MVSDAVGGSASRRMARDDPHVDVVDLVAQPVDPGVVVHHDREVGAGSKVGPALANQGAVVLPLAWSWLPVSSRHRTMFLPMSGQPVNRPDPRRRRCRRR
jgi:hypothetical protein